VKEALRENSEVFDPKFYGKAGREKVRQAAIHKIALSGSKGKGVPADRNP